MTLLGQRPAPVPTYDAVAERSAALVIDGYSTSFGTASRLLGRPVRSHVRNIYALVRIADEVVDSADPDLTVADRADLLDRLEEDTALALRRGRSSNLVVHAFAGTARRCGIGTDLTGPFFGSMRTDLRVTEHDADSLDRYIYGSAEVVGLMCLHAFLTDDRAVAGFDELAPGAQRLGAAFQKVNFLRDLAEDSAVLGRSYFPGVRAETLTDAQRDALLDDVDADLEAAALAVPLLPPSSRRAVAVAAALFGELSRRLRVTPAREIVRRRVSVPTSVKAALVARVLASPSAR